MCACACVCVCVCAYRLGGRDYLRNETAMRKPFPLCLRLFARTKPNYFWHGFLYSDRGAKAGHSKSQLKMSDILRAVDSTDYLDFLVDFVHKAENET